MRISHFVSPLILAAASVVAYRAGGGADPPPRAPVASVASQPSTHPSGDYRAVVRLIERLDDARIDAPRRDAAESVLAKHWRKMQVPWTPLPRAAARFATSIALRTSKTETQWSTTTSKPGRRWEPDARIWNMNEGSFDEREAIVAPPPASFQFHLTIPEASRLTFAPGLVNPARAPVVFSVRAVASGVTTDVCSYRMTPGESGWRDVSCDLSPLAGKTVDLVLDTKQVAASERRHEHDAREPPDSPVPLALWGNPTILSAAAPAVPYNVLWIVIDALRPDVLASFHDDAEDAKKLAAPSAPLEALLPKIGGLTPAIDDLALRGVRFEHAYSAGAWTRPGTLAMLAGARSSELGLETLPWVLSESSVARFYSSAPPLLPLLLRSEGVLTRAFVNNYFMVGYAAVGIDLGFERIDDHRYRTRDTLEITNHAIDWLRANRDTRFFVFCNYNSPHEPWEPPERFLARIPAPPKGPSDFITRKYMAEAAKDDEAVGELVRELKNLGLLERTLIIVTADHGETLSAAHDGTSKLDNMAVRYHHAVSNYEETTRIPILMALDGVLPPGKIVKSRVRNIDIAPTVLSLERMAQNPKMSGSSLLPLLEKDDEPNQRVVISEGRGTRAILAGRHRLLLREGAARITKHGEEEESVAEELYDLENDPGERHNIAPARPDIAREMRKQLDAELHGAHSAVAIGTIVHLDFAGGGASHAVRGIIAVDRGALDVHAGAPSADVILTRVDPSRIAVQFTTRANDVVGLDVHIDRNAAVTWTFALDGAPWPASRVFAGPYGFAAPTTKDGLMTDDARDLAYSPARPILDPLRDFGLFVTQGSPASQAPLRVRGGEGTREMNRLLKEWGYAHDDLGRGGRP